MINLTMKRQRSLFEENSAPVAKSIFLFVQKCIMPNIFCLNAIEYKQEQIPVTHVIPPLNGRSIDLGLQQPETRVQIKIGNNTYYTTISTLKQIGKIRES